jgi:hypothetical protein
MNLKRWRGVFIPVLGIAALLLITCTFCGRERPRDDSSEIEQRLERLKSVPYTSVTSEKVSPDTAGVMLYDRRRAWPGYNLYCSRSAPEALLLDMDGRVVHKWSYQHDTYKVWDYAVLLDNGDVVLLNKMRYVFKLDWKSNLLWETQLSAHHDIAKAADGSLFVIEFKAERYRDLLVRFPNVVHLDADGHVLGRWSTYEHLDDLKQALDVTSFLDTALDLKPAHGVVADSAGTVGARMNKKRKGGREFLYDYFHLNTVTVCPDTPLGRRDARFAAGNLLICLRNVNQIATINWDTGEVLWGWGEGDLEWPHHPTMLDNGNILIFDNGVVRGYSRVLEIEPASGKIVWEYVADPPKSFFTPQKGSAQRLPNGNTLICEGDRGRTFEVTADGETVWEWYNPITVDEKRVQVYRMMRYPVEMVEPLLRR